jgi:hypothetical protein
MCKVPWTSWAELVELQLILLTIKSLSAGVCEKLTRQEMPDEQE